MSQYQHPLGRNLAPQKQVCTHKGAISLSLHPNIMCTPQGANLHFSSLHPLWFRFALFRVQKRFYDCKHEYLGVQICTPTNNGASLLPKGGASVTIKGANLNHYFLVYRGLWFLKWVNFVFNVCSLKHDWLDT